ncbi:MAG: DegT/DnrJ/EryC1/StrS family aminotransferase, partial [Cohaesibacteraceae bacterium]
MPVFREVPVYKPLIADEEKNAAIAALDNGWLGMGSFVKQFEDEIQAVIGSPDRHPVAVSTGHAALHLALLLNDVGPGDEVLTPAFHTLADLPAILAPGAKP